MGEQQVEDIFGVSAQMLQEIAAFDISSRHGELKDSEKSYMAETGGKHFALDTDWRDLLVHLMHRDAVNKRPIGLVEFQRLTTVFHMPIRIRDVSSDEVRYEQRKREVIEMIAEVTLSVIE